MTSLLELPVQHAYTFLAVAMVCSVLLGVRGIAIDLRAAREGTIKPVWLYLLQPFLNNLFGSLAGWLAVYVLSLRALGQTPLRYVGWPDFWLALFALLGTTGKLPETVQGFIISIGKAVETITKKVAG